MRHTEDDSKIGFLASAKAADKSLEDGGDSITSIQSPLSSNDFRRFGAAKKPIFESSSVYTQSHEWIALHGTTGTVGITEYAKNELGDIVYIELPKIGSNVKAGQEVCVLESTKAAVDVYSPASGKITAVNESLVKNPSDLKTQDGWLFKIELSNPKELEKLLSSTEYAKLLK